MDTMRERIARAICDHSCLVPFEFCLGDPCSCRNAADDVLDAMREPTKEMLKAGRAANRLVAGNALGLACIAPDSAWEAMIDAAKEGK